jgi:hypothetical protein
VNLADSPAIIGHVTSQKWVCKVCWQWNRPADEFCWKCKTVPDVSDEQVAEAQKALEAKAALPEPVPDLVVALPVVIFRSYGKVWLRGGIGLLVVLALEVFAAVTDLVWYALTIGFALGLMVSGFLAREISEGMRNREVWAFGVGIVMSVVAVIGSITAFSVLAPGLVNPGAVRWGSLIVFGGAGVAALVGLVLVLRRGDAPHPEPNPASRSTPER